MRSPHPCPWRSAASGSAHRPAGAVGIAALLRRIGRASLSLGRLFEGHVNGIRLVARYGTAAQMARLAEDVADGHLSAIWAADAPAAPVMLFLGRLAGGKAVASGVGVVTRPVVTARSGGEQLVLAHVERGEPGTADLHGVRSAATGPVSLDGVAVPPAQVVGVPGDYMRQPEISLGAWRALAVMLGGLDALTAALAADLRGKGRTGDPHQRARFGRVAMLNETAALWVERAAAVAEAEAPGEAAAAFVKLARIAVEDAATEAIRLAQRSVGIAGFVRPHPLERIARDLSTYLRQPAPDMVLDEAAAFHLGEVP